MQAELLLVAALLRRGRSLDRLSTALSLLALACGLAPLLGAAASPALAPVSALLLLIGLAEKYWAQRVALDAELFQRLAQSGEQLAAQTQSLDQALQRLGLQQERQSQRSWESRSKGALVLLRHPALCLLLQLSVALLAILVPFCLSSFG